jgi:hypothetical protein
MRGVEKAVRDCVGFLLGHQSESGCWTDWDLPPGRSSPWTTAYVGARLAELPGDVKASPGPALRAGARWLLEHERDGGGWGYDDRVACDGDSTAQAVLFLALEGIPVADATRARLLGFEQPGGGFSTYAPDEGLGSWGRAHPDVSPAAAQALLKLSAARDPAVERTVQYVVTARTPNGLWNSFWWSSPLYATRASLSLLRAVGTPIDLEATRGALRRLAPANSFERALLLESLHLAAGARENDLVNTLAMQLVEDQLDDGSWESAPVLRVTSRDCSAPWECTNPGRLYADPDRLFTSATVLSALARHAAWHRKRMSSPKSTDALRRPLPPPAIKIFFPLRFFRRLLRGARPRQVPPVRGPGSSRSRTLPPRRERRRLRRSRPRHSSR